MRREPLFALLWERASSRGHAEERKLRECAKETMKRLSGSSFPFLEIRHEVLNDLLELLVHV